MEKRIVGIAVVITLVIAGGISTAQATKTGPGSCGEHKHWRDGKCVDARDEGQKSWLERMQSQPKWW